MKKNDYFRILAGLFLCSVLMLGSCVEDTLYNTPHPDKGAVVVSTDWSGRSSESIKPAEYILRIGEEEQMVNADVNTFKSLFLPGTQSLQVYHQASGITISGNTATVNTLEDGSLDPSRAICSLPIKRLLSPQTIRCAWRCL